MNDLIEALQILLKYGNPNNPTNCEHDELMVVIHPSNVSEEDIKKLDELGFFVNEEYECFSSFRFGSC
tara:strand:- start:539 stop:742 length:204 start_codon:yes stop_codon:yes gene_type:complete